MQKYIKGIAICGIIAGIVKLNYLEVVSFDTIVPYILFLLLYKLVLMMMSWAEKKCNVRGFSGRWLAGAMFLAILTSLGKMEMIADQTGETVFSVKTTLPIIFCLIGYTAVYYVCIWILDGILSESYMQQGVHNGRKISIKRIAIYSVICLVCWFPYFLNYFPGILTTDSINVMGQIMNNQYNNHHPWIHTLIIQFFYKIGFKILGDVNKAVAFYTLINMVAMAVIFSVALSYIEYRIPGIPKIKRVIMLAFYAVFPINAMYSVTMWKDVLFAGFVLLFLLWLDAEVSGFWDRVTGLQEWLAYIIITFLVCTFRSNGKFAIFLLIPFMGIKFRKKWKIYWLSTGIMLLLLFVYGNVIMPLMGVKQADLVEWLSIPEQQLAYVITNGGDITQEELKEINKVVPIEKIPDIYNTGLSDPVKSLIRNEGKTDYLAEHKAEYFKIYVSIGLKNMYQYITAFSEQTKGYWYHKVTNWICAFGVRDNDLGISRQSLIAPKYKEQIDIFLDCIVNGAIDIFNNYFSLALNTYIIIICFIISWKRKVETVIYWPLLAILITLMLATPVNSEFRYAYSLFISIPVILAVTIANVQRNSKTNEMEQ